MEMRSVSCQAELDNNPNTVSFDLNVGNTGPLSSDSGGGGCTLSSDERVDPMLSILVLAYLIYLMRKRRAM